MKIRMARLEDAKGITEVHCSDIEKWYRYIEGKKIEDAYENLTIRERYLHGGPWMSVESCAIHLNTLLLENQYPIVAEINGKVVGHAEVLISEEPIKGEMKRIADLDVLEVHKKFRRRGVGRAILEYLFELAKDKECELITVTPDPNAVGFYSKLGFNETVYSGLSVNIDLSEMPKREVNVKMEEFPWEKIKTKEMTFGKFQSSYHHWFAIKDKIFGINDRIYYETGIMEHKYYYILKESFSNPKIVYLYLWGENPKEALSFAINRAKYLGFKTLRTLVSVEDYNKIREFKPKIIEKSIILSKRV